MPGNRAHSLCEENLSKLHRRPTDVGFITGITSYLPLWLAAATQHRSTARPEEEFREDFDKILPYALSES